MTEIVIRPAVAGDVPAVAAIVHDAFASFIPLIGRAPAPMLNDYRASVAQGAVWVLTEDGTVAGVAVLKFGDDHLLANPFAVAPGRQGKGHGRRLLAFLEDKARCRGYGEVRLRLHMGMSRSIAFCKSQGYTEYGRAEDDGYVRVCLRKPLAPGSA